MTFDLATLPGGGLGWIDGCGDHASIVLSTRVRLARNVEGYAFSGRARDGERLRVLAQVRDAIFDWNDPLPFLAVHHLQIPSLLLQSLRHGTPWVRVDFNIGKLIAPAGD